MSEHGVITAWVALCDKDLNEVTPKQPLKMRSGKSRIESIESIEINYVDGAVWLGLWLIESDARIVRFTAWAHTRIRRCRHDEKTYDPMSRTAIMAQEERLTLQAALAAIEED